MSLFMLLRLILHRLRTAAILLLVLLPLTASANLPEKPALPEPAGAVRLSDPHDLLSQEEKRAIEEQLTGFWLQTGLTLSIVIDSPNNPWESLESFAQRTAASRGQNGNGDAQRDILLVVDPHARRAAWRTSSDLLAEFPSADVGRIINGTVTPMVMQGALAAGIAEGIKRIAAILAQNSHLNHSLFVRGYGTLAAAAIVIAGIVMRRRWGASKSAQVAALIFAAMVCYDGFTLGFPWYGVLFGAALASVFIGLFVWIGLGSDLRE